MEYSKVYENIFPFWSELDGKDKELLCQSTSAVRFDREQAVHNNAGCTGFFIVKSGRLRIYILSEEGKEITLYRLSPGDICMLAASCVLQSITFDVYIDAEQPSECYMIDASAFGDVSNRYPAVKIYALEKAVERFSDVMWVMQQVVFMSMDKRLAIFLLDESVSVGSDRITMTQEQIARHMGTAREVISRLLRHMASDAILEVTRGGINIIDKNKLRSIAY